MYETDIFLYFYQVTSKLCKVNEETITTGTQTVHGHILFSELPRREHILYL